MPTVPPIDGGAKVLVTGVNGFLASWLARTLLESGYAVRGTVRDAAKGTHLLKIFAHHGPRFEIAVVGDLTEDGAFDEAVKGVDAVEHVAAAVTVAADDPKEVIDPAVKGTIGILRSILAHGTSVKRVVVTGTAGTVLRFGSGSGGDQEFAPLVLDERDWNEQEIQIVEAQGRAASGIAKYRAGKTLAEKAAWELYNAHKAAGDIGWEMVFIHPPWIFGPLIHEVDPDMPTQSYAKGLFYNTVVKGTMDAHSLANVGTAWVDVRDLARVHELALTTPEAAGERIIVSAGSYKWQEWLDAANATNSRLPSASQYLAGALPVGAPGVVGAHDFVFDTSKAARIFGITYRGKEETVGDCLADFRERGW